MALSESPSFLALRRRVADALAMVLLIGGAAAYVPSVWAAIRSELWAVVVVDTVALLLVMGVVASRRALSDGALIGALIIAFWGLGAALVVLVGTNGAGHHWSAGACVIAALLTNGRTTVLALALMAAVCTVAPLLVGGGGLSGAPAGLGSAAVFTVNSLAVAGALCASTLVVIGGLRHATARAEAESAALAQANHELRVQAQQRDAVESRLAQAERLSAVGTLASGIAHDFNNLLTPILLCSEVLMMGEADPRRREMLQISGEAAESARDLVRRILTLTRPATAPSEPAPAGPLLADAVRLLRASLPAQLIIESRIDPDLGEVTIRPSELHQILLNLGTNSHQAMDTAGRIEIVAQAHRDAEGRRLVQVEVSDDGRGMTPEIAARALDPYFTTRMGRGGTGLGLATVHALITSLGGQLGIESAPEQGTRVRFTLPMV